MQLRGDLPKDDDAALVRAAQLTPHAFAPLYLRYRHRIYAYLRARLGEEDAAADLTQQVFLQALSALPRYQVGHIPFNAWLFRIARNAATDRLRKHHIVPLEWVPAALLSRSPMEGNPEASLLHREALEHLQQLVSALDRQSRELLRLRFAADLTVAEIALVVGARQAAVYKRLQRTLQRLKEHYDGPA